MMTRAATQKFHPFLVRMRRRRANLLAQRLEEFLEASKILKRVRMHIDQDEPGGDVGRGLAFSKVCRLLEKLEVDAETKLAEFNAVQDAIACEVDWLKDERREPLENHTESNARRSQDA